MAPLYTSVEGVTKKLERVAAGVGAIKLLDSVHASVGGVDKILMNSADIWKPVANGGIIKDFYFCASANDPDNWLWNYWQTYSGGSSYGTTNWVNSFNIMSGFSYPLKGSGFANIYVYSGYSVGYSFCLRVRLADDSIIDLVDMPKSFVNELSMGFTFSPYVENSLGYTNRGWGGGIKRYNSNGDNVSIGPSSFSSGTHYGASILGGDWNLNPKQRFFDLRIIATNYGFDRVSIKVDECRIYCKGYTYTPIFTDKSPTELAASLAA